MSLIVRDATLEDAEDILAIYNFAAINTTAVWTDGPADLASRRDWMTGRQQAGYPVLVAMKGRDVVGFASFGDFALNFVLVYWMVTPAYGDFMDTTQSINLKIVRRFEEEGIEMAFPTQTIYLNKDGA